MKGQSQFKRLATTGREITATFLITRGSFVAGCTERRIVAKVQSNSIAFDRPDLPPEKYNKGSSHPRWSWLGFESDSHFEFPSENEAVLVLDEQRSACCQRHPHYNHPTLCSACGNPTTFTTASTPSIKYTFATAA